LCIQKERNFYIKKVLVENIELLKQIDKIQKSLLKNGIESDKLVKELKVLREFFIKEGNLPRVVKIIRLSYEHIDKYKTFNISVPDEEDVEQDNDLNEDDLKVDSFSYFLSLLKKPTQKLNAEDLDYYMHAFVDYTDAN
jgi:hypothetical protein